MPAISHALRNHARSPGRPTTVDRVEVGAIALQLWSEKGFNRVTWADIASASGISQRTILRHFSSKEELAWVAVPRATEVLKESFDAADSDAAVSAVISAAVVRSLAVLHEHRSSGPLWLRLISEEPALRASAAAAYQPWVDAITEYISTRFTGMPAASCRGIAIAYQSTAFEALLNWAETDPASEPADVVSQALSWLNFTTPSVQPAH
ncbi:TetR/AcrR family transcriptional regulator [Gulosibacter chungangensis]|uniref:TetR family transcriptional regulator n=1 Tax=Gulosibacter chungangensis TaxID=979746 RepID=A0A7J5B8F5_9MICO|nr:TetR/AcrR family transcriptional regulator [Gulosibacter chungangensis]KAB1641449.1 TetR family transcriptional regulator [Gulosibacter chungangensis]